VRALVVRPGVPASGGVVERPPPGAQVGEVLLAPLLVGVCGTDREIVAGAYGEPTPGGGLTLGHECVARVVAGRDGLDEGRLVVPIVRHPDPVPCGNCAAGQWDMCRNGRYREHGIRGLDGFAAELAVTTVDHVVAVPDGLGELAVLVEPASVVAKAWQLIDRVAARAAVRPRLALITGAGPIGLLAALLARQRGLETHVVDIVETGPKPALVGDIGAEYHTGRLADSCPEPDVIVECTGVGTVVLDAIERNSPTGIVCLTGISSGSRAIGLDAAALNRRLVLENDVVFGTVNANRSHYEAAVGALGEADREWLARLITRRVPLESWQDALVPRPDDVKTVIEVGSAGEGAGTDGREAS
jgi:threonine dehydrogenase-like Zn-dependent dehydrogenase